MLSSSTNSDDRHTSLDIKCATCGKHLSDYDIQTDDHIPPPQELFAMGAVPVPNLGWFCSQKCAEQFETEYSVKFQRDGEGKVRYYP